MKLGTPYFVSDKIIINIGMLSRYPAQSKNSTRDMCVYLYHEINYT